MTYTTAKDGTRLYVKDWGTGPAIVLIHGWPLDADMWDYQALALARAGYRVIAYDRRGFGRSDQPWTGYDYDTLADDLAAVLTDLKVTDATLVGFSMGGGEVARYIGNHGTERVAKAVLVSSVVPFMLKSGDNEGAPESLFEEMKAGIEKDRHAFFTDFGKQFFGADKHPSVVSAETLRWSSTVIDMASIKATLDCVDAFGKTDFRADLEKFDVPTLVIHGTEDATVPIDIAGRKVKALKPDVELIEYEGAPHGLFITEKDRLTADLLAFIKR